MSGEEQQHEKPPRNWELYKLKHEQDVTSQIQQVSTAVRDLRIATLGNPEYPMIPGAIPALNNRFDELEKSIKRLGWRFGWGIGLAILSLAATRLLTFLWPEVSP